MALGLNPRRRYAIGGPLDGAYLPEPVDFDPLNAEQRQAIRTPARSRSTNGSVPNSSPNERSQKRPTSRDLVSNAVSPSSLQQLVTDSLSDSAAVIAESAAGVVAGAQSHLASELLSANIGLSRDVQRGIHESNDRLIGRVDHLSALTERLILETKRTKTYLRDAVRFISD